MGRAGQRAYRESVKGWWRRRERGVRGEDQEGRGWHARKCETATWSRREKRPCLCGRNEKQRADGHARPCRCLCLRLTTYRDGLKVQLTEAASQDDILDAIHDVLNVFCVGRVCKMCVD